MAAVPAAVPSQAQVRLVRTVRWQPLPLEPGPASDRGTRLRNQLPQLHSVLLPPGIDPAVRGRLQPRRRLG
ncbi:hypothetical protein [Dactylosporangium sp. CA-092794]|uniref:hypothetical protein n=1 Tax=Dactylosporangium sp. CA-092794 TaxID=3239929 RepID=UPI003D93B65B